MSGVAGTLSIGIPKQTQDDKLLEPMMTITASAMGLQE